MQAQKNKNKLLIVEQSAPMMRVLRDYCKRQMLDADCHSDPAQALAALNARFENYASDYSGVVLGWPENEPLAVGELLDGLAQADHSGLPMVVLCQQISGEIQAFARRRPATRVSLWSEYQQLDRLVQSDAPRHDMASPARPDGTLHLLLIDSAPCVSMALHGKLTAAGHAVDSARDAESAIAKLATNHYHLIAVDHRIHADSDALAEQLAALAATTVVVLADALGNGVTLQCLRAGARACFDKSEDPAALCRQLESLAALASEPPAPSRSAPAPDLNAALRQVLSAIEQPALIVDRDDRVVVASDGAQALLGAVSEQSFSAIAGQSLEQLRAAPDSDRHLQLQGGDGSAQEVAWQCRAVDVDGLDELLLFTFAAIAVPEQTTVVDAQPRLMARNSILTPAELHAAIDDQIREPAAGCQSLLLLDIEIVAASGDRMDLGSSEPMLKIVRNALVNVYKGQRSIGYLGEGRFAFVLSTARLQDALLLARKLLQVVPQVVRYADALKLVSHGAMYYHQPHSTVIGADEVLQKCADGCQISRSRGDDLVYVIHMNQWLSARAKKNKTAEESLPAQA